MFTKQYKLYRYMMFRATLQGITNAAGTSVTASPACSWQGDFGNGMALARCNDYNGENGINGEYTSSSTGGANKIGIFFGSGSTPPTEDDYRLDVPITTGLSITNSGLLFEDKGDGKYIFQANYTAKNTTAEEITIREIGYFGEIGRGSGSKYYYSYALFERTVLDEPIVIAPGTSKIVTYTLTFNQPSQ